MFWKIQRIRMQRILRQLTGQSTPWEKSPRLPKDSQWIRWDEWFANPTPEQYESTRANILRATGGHF